MPYPLEIVSYLEKNAARIVNPQTPRAERRSLVSEYRQGIVNAYDRADIIHGQFTAYLESFPGSTFKDLLTEFESLQLSEEEKSLLKFLHKAFHVNFETLDEGVVN